MKKLSFLTLCLLVMAGTVSCSKENSAETDPSSTDRLILTEQEYFQTMGDLNNYELLEQIGEKYGHTYQSKVPLAEPVLLTAITEQGAVQRKEVDSDQAINFLLNENNVLQYDCWVIFVSPDGESVKKIYSEDYDAFISDNSNNPFSIPSEIVQAEIILHQTRNIWDCAKCAVLGIACLCGGGDPITCMGAFEACVKCFKDIICHTE